MVTDKIVAVIDEHEYVFNIDIQQLNNEPVYLAKPLMPAILEGFKTSYIKLDGRGNLLEPRQVNELRLTEIADAVWRGIKEQKINNHTSFNRPL